MTSISAKQQPTQNSPWSTPSRSASRRGARPRQRDATKPKGVRQRSRQRYFQSLNWKAPAPARTTAPTAHPWAASQGEPAAIARTPSSARCATSPNASHAPA